MKPMNATSFLAILAVANLLLLLPDVAHSYNLPGGYTFDDLFKSSSGNAYDDDKDSRAKVVERPHRDDNIQRHLLEQRLLERQQRSDDLYIRHEKRNLEEQTLTTGLFHTCAITHRAGVQDSCGEHSCGPAKCWGHNDRGQSTPPPGVMFEQLSAGGFFTCGLKPSGKVVCWGDIDHPPRSLELLSSQELSDFKHARRLQQQAEGWRGGATPQRINGDDYYVQVSSGMRHACAITRDSEVHCWGRNDYGESTPPDGKFVQVSAGHSFTCGIRPNGAVQCWGKNDMGQSRPPQYPENVFQQISTSLGGDHACGVLAENGHIRCWGNNGRGQSEDQDGTFLQVTAGSRTTCAVRVDNELISLDGDSTPTSIHCWGSRANSLLDHFVDGTLKEKKTNNNISGQEHQQISLGQDHACATSTKGEDGSMDTTKTFLECWWMAGSDFDAHRIPVGLEMVM